MEWEQSMCYAIYTILIGLFLIYSDAVLEPLALSEQVGEGEWMVVALGWEMLFSIWPLLLMAMVVASALTFFVMRWLKWS
jgi:hypothetical protein